MVTSSDNNDLIVKAFEGATNSLVKLSAKQIDTFLTKLENHDLAFIEDPDIIKRIKGQRDSPSWKFYETYVKNPDLRIQVQAGLTLRGYTKNNDKDNIEKLRGKIGKRYGIAGLHIAEYVSSNILSKYIASLIDSTSSAADITIKVEGILKNVERDVVFIKNTDNAKEKADTIKNRINTNVPGSFIIASTRKASKIHNKILKLLENKFEGYTIATNNDDIEMVTFINKIS